MGLISLTWIFCHNLVKTHSEVIEIFSFSCPVLLLVKADGDHLAVPNCKKAKMGLISLTWIFCHNLVKTHSEVIEIFSFSCPVLLLVKADGDHLAVPNCKKKIMDQFQKMVLERYRHFCVYAIFSNGPPAAILTGIFLFNFETIPCKNHFDTNLVIEILSFSCSVLFLVMANGGHLGMPNRKKSKRLHTRNILAKSWINFNQWFLRYCHFCIYAIFSNGP